MIGDWLSVSIGPSVDGTNAGSSVNVSEDERVDSIDGDIDGDGDVASNAGGKCVGRSFRPNGGARFGGMIGASVGLVGIKGGSEKVAEA